MRICVMDTAVNEPWGRLSVDDARAAADRLSDYAFKVWVLLALNQGGYVWEGDLDTRTIDTLFEHGYLVELNDDAMIFDASGDARELAPPPAWEEIAYLYGRETLQDYLYVRDKLKEDKLSKYEVDILLFWLDQYEALVHLDRTKIQNPIKYDLAVVLRWYVREKFSFEEGDSLDVGENARNLRFNDLQLRGRIQRAVVKNGSPEIKMYESNAKNWTCWLRNGDVEVPPKMIGTILEKRLLENGCFE